MKKPLLTLAASVLCVAFAFDLKAIEESRLALTGAFNGVLDGNIGVAQYIPGYGFHLAAREYSNTYEPQAVIDDLKTVLTALAGTVEGLDAGDWVSMAYRGDDPPYELLARIKPSQPDTLEVWLDGVKQ